MEPRDVTAEASAVATSSLLRLFQSEFFDAGLLLSYLYRSTMQGSQGVIDFLCNRLYQVTDVEVEFYLPQLTNLLLHGLASTANLERFLLDKCAGSMHLAFHFYWLLTSYMEDEPHNPYVQSLRAACEMAVVNARRVAGDPDDGAGACEAVAKVQRSEYFSAVLALVDRLVRVSSSLRSVDVADRPRALQERLEAAWTALGSGTDSGSATLPPAPYIPLWPADARHFAIARLPPGQAVVLNSRERVPYMCFFEVIWADVASSSTPNLHETAAQQDIDRVMRLVRNVEDDGAAAAAAGQEAEQQPRTAVASEADALAAVSERLPQSELEVVDEQSWRSRRQRIARESPLSRDARWDVLSVIVKYGDDCRQERLAVQLLAQMKRIFDAAALPLWLHPHGILVVGARAALIETIPNVKSLHQHKQTHPHIKALFQQRYGEPTSAAYELALRNFVESLAGYSIACYLLAIKDRHNGNILLDADGHLVHIDFGFMLGTSPGSLQFESAPFKLVPEWVELLDGDSGDPFNYWKALMVKGFIELQKHRDKVLVLLEMMTLNRTGAGTARQQPQQQPIACLRGGGAVAGVRQRFDALGRTEADVVAAVTRLAAQSRAATSTRLYDQFQYLQNGILYKAE